VTLRWVTLNWWEGRSALEVGIAGGGDIMDA
jgi:hypothetical protein